MYKNNLHFSLQTNINFLLNVLYLAFLNISSTFILAVVTLTVLFTIIIIYNARHMNVFIHRKHNTSVFEISRLFMRLKLYNYI